MGISAQIQDGRHFRDQKRVKISFDPNVIVTASISMGIGSEHSCFEHIKTF